MKAVFQKKKKSYNSFYAPMGSQGKFSQMFSKIIICIQPKKKIIICIIQNKRFSLTGYKSLGRLRNLEILDLQINNLDDNIFPFLSAARSLKTLFLRLNNLDCPFPAKGVCFPFCYVLNPLNFIWFNIICLIFFFDKVFVLYSVCNIVICVVSLSELKVLTNLELLDLCENKFNCPIPIRGNSKLLPI